MTKELSRSSTLASRQTVLGSGLEATVTLAASPVYDPEKSRTHISCTLR